MDINKILKSDYLDILYDGKNKKYGGYLLRKKYNQRAVMSAIIAGALACLIILISLYEPKEEVVEMDDFKIDDVTLAAPPPLDPEAPPPPPPPTAPPPPVKPTVKFTPPVVAPNEEVREEDLPDQPDPSDNVEQGKITLEGVASPDAISPNLATTSGDGRGRATQPSTPADEVIHRVVEVMPEFPGGERALIRYLQNNIVYPPEARRNLIQGTVHMQFVVEPDGSISNVKIVRDPGGGLGAEAARVVRNMPKWKAGRQNNRNVRVSFSLPVDFTLQ